jgi:hypothetical protein
MTLQETIIGQLQNSLKISNEVINNLYIEVGKIVTVGTITDEKKTKIQEIKERIQYYEGIKSGLSQSVSIVNVCFSEEPKLKSS